MIRSILIAVAALAILVPALLVRYAPPVVPQRTTAHAPGRVVPAAELPPVEPMAFVALAPDDARAFNAQVPFVTGPNPAARPFRFAGDDADRARAVDCLAAALIYEAGNDSPGQRAVAQVVLNRLRHPAFPKTVCGVVFEGQERRTGCQFTFTCDGAMTRWAPTPEGWARAQAIAAAALNGAVHRGVGWATHYHTDWVVPYWQSSLDKIAKVGTHLFFRWTGWWGTAGAFRAPDNRDEPAIAKMSALSTAHGAAEGLSDDAIAAAIGLPETTGDAPVPVAGDPNSFLVTLPADTAAVFYPALAAKACGDRPLCKFSAWTDATKTPAALPLAPEQIATMSFSYLRDRPAGVEKTLWNCRQAPRPDRSQCMKVQVLSPVSPPAPLPTPTAIPAAGPKGPDLLEGVRRRSQPPGPPLTRSPLPALRLPSPAARQPAPAPTPKATATPTAP